MMKETIRQFEFQDGSKLTLKAEVPFDTENSIAENSLKSIVNRINNSTKEHNTIKICLRVVGRNDALVKSFRMIEQTIVERNVGGEDGFDLLWDLQKELELLLEKYEIRGRHEIMPGMHTEYHELGLISPC